MIAALMVTATLAARGSPPRFGSRPLVPPGMLLAAAGMFLLTGSASTPTYVADILPALLPLGLGMGLIFAPSMSTATAGVAPMTRASRRPWSTPRSKSAARSAPRC